jgi:hypothetical protein
MFEPFPVHSQPMLGGKAGEGKHPSTADEGGGGGVTYSPNTRAKIVSMALK